ncbi:hypothetical protein E2562_001428 [Oryza meyeriana var. granulata]|uniref:Glycolipid transfer protein domain-containing protein n=1 Tax=Oryza meyeriana var. granulata TaxID=110450 RepID=A0A6G1DCM9_9ORYZ|nr:hypothetical protein E2562_001428 [Oryza meyeriana var. granulata]
MLGFRSQMPWSAPAAAPAEPMCDAAAAVVAARKGMETPLTAVAEAFEELARRMEADGGELRLGPFGDTCALVSVLFSCLGIAFRFAEIEYVAKVNDLIGAAKSYGTLNDILDKDVENDCVKKQGSHSRNLRRVRLGLGLIKVLFEQFLSTQDCSLYDAATTAYGQVCAPFHSWAVRKAVGAGMYTLPSREQLIVRLNETDCSVQKEMRRYIDASSPIIDYIDNLFLSRNISLDW